MRLHRHLSFSVNIVLCFLASFMLAVSCNEGSEDTSHIKNQHDVAGPDAETLAMIDSVRQACEAVNPEKISFYLTPERARIYKAAVSQTKGLQQLNMYLQYGYAELKAGNTEVAIQVFEDLLSNIESINLEEKEATLYQIRRLLALAYLRLGEQENCILNHSIASCIVPIIEEGQHVKPRGSEEALKRFEVLLSQNPSDLTSKYLLNIAAMTLGRFPDGVKSEHRLPPDFFVGKSDFPRFYDIAPSLGIDVRGLAGGVAIADFNNDGLLDILVSSWGFNDQIRLFIRAKDGSFTDMTEQAGLTGFAGGLNMAHADYNNDGFVDVLVLRGAWFGEEGKIPNSLLRNNGDGTFTDVAVSSGIYSKGATQTAVWTDIDLDGWVDLFIGNEATANAPYPCELYRNNGDGTFTDITRAANLDIRAFVKGVTAGDINNDGLPDLYISYHYNPNSLLLNETNASGIQFRNVGETAGVGEPMISFPTWIFDYNNDGYQDIFVSAYSSSDDPLPAQVLRAYGKKDDPSRPRLYRNNGDGTFTDVSSDAGLVEPAFTMGSNYGDLDNDGFLDIYLGTGEPDLMSVVPNKMYLNRNGEYFEDVTYSGGFGNIQKGHGVGFGDFDQDGDEDIYVVMGGSFEGDVYQNILFENPLGNKNNWCVIRLEGVHANRMAIGARLIINIQEGSETRTIYRTISGGSSFGGNSLQEEIGLGKDGRITKLSINWPSRKSSPQVFENLEVNSAYFIREGEEIEKIPYKPLPFKKTEGTHHHAM